MVIIDLSPKRDRMDRAAFMKGLHTTLYPILRAEGFRGSGSTLRRVIEPVVHVFNVQASSDGKMCYLNLGAHLTFLPMPGGGMPDAMNLKEYECVFRDRFDPPAGTGFGWSYGSNEDELHETIAFICDHWPIHGHAFFDQYSEYPDSFVSLVDDVEVSTAHPIELLTLARIAAHLHNTDRAESLAREALKRCPERASALRGELHALVRAVKQDQTGR